MANYVTTRKLAEITGIQIATLRSFGAKMRNQFDIELQAPQEEWPDLRTPLWDADLFVETWNNRPGPIKYARRNSSATTR